MSSNRKTSGKQIKANEKVEDLSMVVELQQTLITSKLNLDQLMHLVCEKTQSLVNGTGAVVEIAEDQQMVYKSCTGTLSSFIGVRLDINTSLSGLSVKKNEVMYCEDSESDPRVNREASRKVGARSMICVPLYHEAKVVGVLKVVSPQAHAFTERHIEMLRVIAALLSAMIARAHEADEKNKALELLKQSEVALRESESKAHAATKTKSEFLANMSHEIRTPINGIMGLVDLLLETSLNYQQREYTEIIKRSSDNLLSIVNDILDLSKIEARKLTLEKIGFDFWQLLEDVRKAQSHLATKKGLYFTSFREPHVARFIYADPTRLRQIITNLMSNAIKFTSTGGMTLKVSTSNEFLLFEIEDTGIGIPAESIDKMFKPFSQVDSSTTRKFGGTGLGLSICHHLVQSMNGEIGVTSKEGHGSTFWFKIPYEVASENSASDIKQEVQHITPSLRVLLAEDNSVNQMITTKMLQKMGHQVSVANDGHEVLEALKKDKYDLILMDCQMPNLDGYEATRRIRNENKSPISQIPIIAMTANALEGDREKCIQAGMNDYVSKPTTFDSLQATISRTIKVSSANKKSSRSKKTVA